MTEIPGVFPASKLGEYKVSKDIAEGTFGKVKMATHTITGQRVAMKYISKAAIYHNRTKTRVQREVEYMRTLRHPHIIKLYEVISTPNDIIIVLEYAGGELFNYIVANGRLRELQARRFFQQLISGIQYSHSIKIVHRDLKPENVLLDEDLNVKIADFGLSNEIRDGDFLKTSCGSPNYAAPEVIRGARYTGPEIDVWSSGVILYVMLCGRLPFEDEEVQRLFAKINQGQYLMPDYLSEDARSLISRMLVVDAFRRITIPEITQHPFFTTDLPRYLTPLPPPPGPVLGTLSSLVSAPNNTLDFEIIHGLGRIDEDVVEDLAQRMEGVHKEDIWEALRRDDGVQGNAVKVAYMLLRDKRRQGRDLAELEEQERDALLAAMDPRNFISPTTKAMDLEDDDPLNDDEGADASEDPLDLSPFSMTPATMNTFAVLDSSLPLRLPDQLPEPHHLASYASATARRSAGSPASSGRDRRQQRRTRWHFGIRSQSPPMEVMLEIYRTLKALGMEWKEKGNLGGLGGLERQGRAGAKVERNAEMDGSWYFDWVDFKAASDVYFVEARARVEQVVILLNLQLYMVDSINYLVDFTHKASYRASTEPGAGKFDAAPAGSPSAVVVRAVDDEDVVSPFAFMDVACKLILELAGAAE